jgi:hypothetical protein
MKLCDIDNAGRALGIGSAVGRAVVAYRAREASRVITAVTAVTRSEEGRSEEGRAGVS